MKGDRPTWSDEDQTRLLLLHDPTRTFTHWPSAGKVVLVNMASINR
jgi:hypothetical protein